ncbi:hypothetical protein [Hoeflea sp.]|uniref:hypothetical protein n=1 Tax=Hoeflea sp. TaxID=1940281 RepID=UPI003A952BC8
MSFRELNQRFLAPAAQSLMIFGIVSLCQPWSLLLHQYGVTLTLIGLVSFMVTSKIAPDPEKDEGFIEESLDALDLSEANDPTGSNTRHSAGGSH